jgi:hypothetical protein
VPGRASVIGPIEGVAVVPGFHLHPELRRSGNFKLPPIVVELGRKTGTNGRVLEVDPLKEPVPKPKRTRRPVIAPAWRADEVESVEQRERGPGDERASERVCAHCESTLDAGALRANPRRRQARLRV